MIKSLPIKQSILALSAGAFLVGCAGMHHEHSRSNAKAMKDYSYQQPSYQQSSYGQQTTFREGSGAQATYSDTSASQAEKQWIIPLYEEKLNVGKRTVDAGQVKIRKVVTTETVNQPIELRKESLIIEREASGAQLSGTSQEFTGAPFEEKIFTISLREEQPVVEKSTQVKERVVAKKSAEWLRQNIQRDVRQENVMLDKSGTAANVTVHGQFESAGTEQGQIFEPAGAERTWESKTHDYEKKMEPKNSRGGAEDLLFKDE